MTDNPSTNLDPHITKDAPLDGGVFFRLALPSAQWFWAEVADSLLSMTDPDNWLQGGTVTVDEAVSAATDMLMSFQTFCGAIIAVTWSTIPDGYLLCDGTSYARVDYPLLYACLDAVFQTDADNFVVPDLRGRVPVGVDGTISIGDTGGEKTHTLSAAEMPSHSHTESTAGPTVIPVGVGVPAPSAIPGIGVTGGAGADTAHNNMQPYVGLRYIICAR